MTDIRKLLDSALPPQAPPIAITRDLVISAGRRARRRRLALAVASAAAVLAVIATAASVVAASYGRKEPAGPPASQPTEIIVTAPPHPPTSVGPTASAPAFDQNPRPVTEPTAAALTRLTTLTTTWASNALSGFTISTVDSAMGLPDQGPALSFRQESPDLVANAVLSDAKGTGQIAFMAWARGSRSGMGDVFNTICASPGDALTCETRIGPGGEHIVILSAPLDPNDEKLVILTVAVSKPDGTEITASSTNAGPGPSRPVRSEIPVGADQLLDLILDSGFTLYP
jgi:hypothetical protein